MKQHLKDLITILQHSGLPKKPLSIFLLFALLAMAACIATSITIGIRAEWLEFQPSGQALQKTLILGSIFLASVLWLKDNASPVKNTRGIYAFMMAFALLAVFVSYEWFTMPQADILMPLYTINFAFCLGFVSLYAVIGMGLAAWVLRFYAPSDPQKAASLTGLAAAASGALAYSFHCDTDGPTYIAIAYGLPVLISTLAGRLILPQFLRW